MIVESNDAEEVDPDVKLRQQYRKIEKLIELMPRNVVFPTDEEINNWT